MLVLYDHVITLDKEVRLPSLDLLAVNYILGDQIEWIWTFVSRIKYLLLCVDPILKAPMATAKDYVPHQPLCSHLAHGVCHVYYFSPPV